MKRVVSDALVLRGHLIVVDQPNIQTMMSDIFIKWSQ